MLRILYLSPNRVYWLEFLVCLLLQEHIASKSSPVKLLISEWARFIEVDGRQNSAIKFVILAFRLCRVCEVGCQSPTSVRVEN